MGLLENLSERSGRLSEDMTAYSEGGINGGQMALRTAGETAGGVGDLAMVPLGAVEGVMDTMNPVYKQVKPIFLEGVKAVMEGVTNSAMYKIGEKWMKDNPEQARDVVSALNVGSLLPGAALGKVGKGVTTYGKAAEKGGALSGVSNWIPNHYAPERPTNMMENLAGKAIDATGKIPKGMGALAAQKAGSFVTHADKSAGNVMKHLTSPTSRATYGEHGISKPSQDIVRSELKKDGMAITKPDGTTGTYNRAGEKGVAQVQYGSHIADQAGRVGDRAAPMKEITDRAFIQDAQPLSEQTLAQTFASMGHKVDKKNASRSKKMDYNDKEWKDLTSITADPKDSAFAAKYIMQAQNPNSTANFVVKAPSNIESGGHFSDVVHKNPANQAVADVFAKRADHKGNVDIETLFTELEGVRDVANKKLKDAGRVRDGWRVVNKDLAHVRENGLWLAGGKGGSAVTEGGVMWLQKLEPNGNTTTFMVDMHDFLEKGRVGKMAMDKLIPNNQLAVTPPMMGNIKTQRKIRRKTDKSILKAPEHFQQTPNRKNWKGEKPTREGGLLEQYTNVTPSSQNVRGEQLKMAGKAATAGGLLYAGNN